MNETDDVDDDGLAVMGFLDLIDDGLFADTGTAATHSYSAAPTLDRPPPHLPFLLPRFPPTPHVPFVPPIAGAPPAFNPSPLTPQPFLSRSQISPLRAVQCAEVPIAHTSVGEPGTGTSNHSTTPRPTPHPQLPRPSLHVVQCPQ